MLGSSNPGENNGMAKVTWEEVRQIRKKWLTGKYTQPQLATKYGLTFQAVSKIVKNETWADSSYVWQRRVQAKKLTQEDVNMIRKMYGSGKYSLQNLADKFNVSNPTIHGITSGKYWQFQTGVA
jgi:uncharacterized protein YjcR